MTATEARARICALLIELEAEGFEFDGHWSEVWLINRRDAPRAEWFTSDNHAYIDFDDPDWRTP